MASYDRRIRFGSEAETQDFPLASVTPSDDFQDVMQDGEASLYRDAEGGGPFRSWADIVAMYADQFANRIYLGFSQDKANGDDWPAPDENMWPTNLRPAERIAIEIQPSGVTAKFKFRFVVGAELALDRFIVTTPRTNPFYFTNELVAIDHPPEILAGDPAGAEAMNWSSATNTASQATLTLSRGGENDPFFEMWGRLLDFRQAENLQLASGVVSSLTLTEVATFRVRYDPRINLFATLTYQGNAYNVYQIRPVGRKAEMEIYARRTIDIPTT